MTGEPGPMDVTAAPPPSVLRVFGARESVERLPGGEGTCWTDGAIVLKPVDDEDFAIWNASLFESLEGEGFVVPRPVRGGDAWVVEDWAAWRLVPGTWRPDWRAIVRAGEAFHAALRGVDRPSFLHERDDRWAVADRAVWSEGSLERFADVQHVAALAERLEPVDAPSQLVHGDLSGNVLLADGRAPCVIDLSPYWRPAGYATAVVVSDALAWHEAPDAVVGLLADLPWAGQYLARAVLFRVIVDALFQPAMTPRADHDDPFRRPVRAALALIDDG